MIPAETVLNGEFSKYDLEYLLKKSTYSEIDQFVLECDELIFEFNINYDFKTQAVKDIKKIALKIGNKKLLKSLGVRF